MSDGSEPALVWTRGRIVSGLKIGVSVEPDEERHGALVVGGPELTSLLKAYNVNLRVPLSGGTVETGIFASTGRTTSKR